MIEYLIVYSADEYSVSFRDEVILVAKRRNSFLGVDVCFEGKDGRPKYFSRLRDVFGFIVVYHRMTFIQDGYSSPIRSKKKGKGFEHNGNTYSIMYSILKKVPSLYLNDTMIDFVLEVVASSVGGRKIIVRCPDEELCEMFSVLYISLDWFDVN